MAIFLVEKGKRAEADLMGKLLRVALALRQEMIPAADFFFLGAHRYAHSQPDWKIVWANGTTRLSWKEALATKPDGILGVLFSDHKITRKAVGMDRVVILNNEPCAFHQVVSDGFEAGRRGAIHLLERRLENFAYVGYAGRYFSEQRKEGFLAGLKKGGHTAPVPVMEATEFGVAKPGLRKWLKSLSFPCGILCATDLVGMKIIVACREEKIAVPQEIAVLGIANDERICVESPIPLSSVDQLFESVGFQGAAFLDRLMRRKPVPEGPVFIPPGDVVVRESTQIFGGRDPLVNRALTIIHREHPYPLTMKGLLGQLGHVSQRLLAMHFRDVLGRSPYQEILRARVNRAQKLLRNTHLPLEEIADQTGFYDASQFNRHFRKICRQTPSRYRKINMRKEGPLR